MIIVKNNTSYDTIIDSNIQYYQSSKSIQEFALTNSVFEWGKFKQFTWNVKVEANVVIDVTNVDETLGFNYCGKNHR